VDRHDIGALPQPQRRKQTRNAEHVVEMAMRQQEPVQPSESVGAENTFSTDLTDFDAMVANSSRSSTRSGDTAKAQAIGGAR
jgi:hypothetical protein